MGRKLTAISTTAGTHKYSKKGLAFLDNVAQGMTIDLAAKAAGLSPRHGHRLWAMDVTKAHIRSRAAERLVLAAPRAAERMVELMASESQRTAFQAAELILGVNAIKPPAAPSGPSVNIGIGIGGSTAGFCIVTREQREAFDKLVATGAIGAVKGYVLDLAEPDNAPRYPGGKLIEGTATEVYGA
jgi:hypothetical protein